MKKLFTLLATVTLSVMLFAQAPQSFSYQTVIRDASWNVLSNQSLGIKISILEDAANGNVVYEETHSATTSTIGLVNLSVGGGVVVNGVFNTIDWGNHTYFIEVAVDVTGGISYIVMGTTQLRSVPYALYAETSGTPGTPGPQGIQGVAGLNGTNSVCGFSIGDTAYGGIIFYLDATGCHGLVAKATDEAGTYQWSSPLFSNTLWASASGIYGGAQNTKKSIACAVAGNIISSCAPDSCSVPAASVCDNLASGGYTDWYLPSRDELDMMYLNLHLQGLGGFANNYYWGSNEDWYTLGAWSQNFSNGYQYGANKDSYSRVRAVRAF